MAAGGQVGGGGLPSKRLKRDENTEPNRQKDLTAEQKATVERNRQLALARRSERQKLGEPPGSEVNMEEQMEKIRRNREAALQRKRQREAAQQSSQEMQKKEDKDEDMEPPQRSVLATHMGQDAVGEANDSQVTAEATEIAEKEQEEVQIRHELPSKVVSDSGGGQDVLPKSARDSGAMDQDLSEQTTEEGDAKSVDEDDEDDEDNEDEEDDEDDEDDEEESQESSDDLSSGSSSSSSYSGSACSMDKGDEEEVCLEDVEHPDVEEKAPSATQEDKDDKEEEEEVPVDWEQLRCLPARPRGEPPCCTERWEPVNLKVISSGEAVAPKSRELRSAKQSLVAKLLCRWWYVLPDWPPKDFDYAAALAARGYRAVPVSEFEEAADLEGELRKVFALPNGYEGLYRDEQGSLIDVRPVEGRPSYDQLMCRSNAELHELLLLAYTRQLEVLESKTNGGEAEKALQQQLRLELKQAKNSLFKFGGSKV